MCTAIYDKLCGRLFGRTLDLEYSLGEEVILVPRDYPVPFRRCRCFLRRYAMLGIGCVRSGFPLYYDGVNEKGLAVAALNFPLSAVYREPVAGLNNLSSFELIPYILGTCGDLSEAVRALSSINVTRDAFSAELSPTPLHWIIADKCGCITVEPFAEGLKISDNPLGVLANEPRFDYHMTHLADYMALGSIPPQNSLAEGVDLPRYSRGMGAMGLPGDFSSASRFVRAAFVKNHTLPEGDGVGRFFHLMSALSVPLGCVLTDEGRAVKTVYTSCVDLDKLTYHFTTYENPSPRAISFSDGALDANAFTRFAM